MKALYGLENRRSLGVIKGRLIEIGLRALELGSDVVIDFGLWGRDERSALRQAAADLGAAVDMRYFELTPGEQRRRLDRRHVQRSRTRPRTCPTLSFAEWAAIISVPTPGELEGSEPMDPPPTCFPDVGRLAPASVAPVGVLTARVRPTRTRHLSTHVRVIPDCRSRHRRDAGPAQALAGRGLRRPPGPGARHIRPWVGPSFVTTDVAGARATLQRYADATVSRRQPDLRHPPRRRARGRRDVRRVQLRCRYLPIGCWLEPAAEGRGLITAACRMLLRYAFEERGLHRVEWRCREQRPQLGRGPTPRDGARRRAQGGVEGR